MSEAESAEKRVTWAELFFDLVFVLAVVQVTSLLGEHHRWWGIARAFVILVIVYRVWVATSLQTNRLGRDATLDRISLFAVALCGLFVAIAIPDAYAQDGLQFAVFVWLARLILFLRFIRRARPRLTDPLTINALVIGPFLLLGALLPDTTREVVWALCALVDLTILFTLRRARIVHRYASDHVRERFGLLVLIALGESLLDIGVGLAREGDQLSITEGAAVVVSFAFTCSLWWAYFDSHNSAITSALEAAEDHRAVTRHVIVGHFGVIAAIVMVAVGFENMLPRPAEPLTLTHLNLLYLGLVVFIASLAYMRWAISRVVRVARLVCVVVVFALVPLALMLPGILATGLLVLVLVTVMVVEKRWPTLTSRGTRALPG